jgi:hypothetical protein
LGNFFLSLWNYKIIFFSHFHFFVHKQWQNLQLHV